MDESKEYIKMCEEAKNNLYLEIKLYEGTSYYDKRIKNFNIACYNCSCEGYGQTADSLWRNDDFIPLFSQDQLQEMIDDPWNEFYEWITEDITGFKDDSLIYDINSGLLYKYPTGEQLWLAFVMEKKYEKKWNGKGWVGIKN